MAIIKCTMHTTAQARGSCKIRYVLQPAACKESGTRRKADQSKQVWLRKSSDKRQLTSTPCVSRSGEAVCMQFITRGKTAWSHADISPGCLLHDAVYQDRRENKVQTGATFERLLRKLADKANRIREQHHLPEDPPVIIIMDCVTSHSQEALTPIKDHLH